MIRFLFICLGGALGTGARVLVVSRAERLFGSSLWGTLAVNLVGSFLLALLVGWGQGRGGLPPLWRNALGAGVLGGFTTYSAFSVETLQALLAGSRLAALGYTALTLVGCLLASALGWTAARQLGG